MAEHQTIEWKQSWRKEYLKWICGYANAQGGTLYIGKDDDVNLHTENGLDYIEINVDKYPSLISYHGKYYYRSGSTMHEITGAELDRKLLMSQGKTWDGIPIPKLRVEDLSQEAIKYFKEKAVIKGRLSKEDVAVPDDILMENLHLIDENGYLIRAAMLAFYPDPEKWVTGSYIKIGFFGESDSDLKYQDEIHGPLIMQVDRAVDLVYTKYLKAYISYEGIFRKEQFMFHRDGFREILLNACVHKNFSGCTPIQISVYNDKIYIWNDGIMPLKLQTTEQLFKKHSSKPFNPKLANIFFLSGMIEAWGRGFDKIKAACDEYEGELPEYDISEDGIMVYCKACDAYISLMKEDMQGKQGAGEVEAEDMRNRILEFCKTPRSPKEIMDFAGIKSKSTLKRKYMDTLMAEGKLKQTLPDKPTSRNQKYFSV